MTPIFLAWTIFGILLVVAILGALLMDSYVPDLWIGIYVTAFHLRAMNMLFEGLKEKGALVIVPSSAA